MADIKNDLVEQNKEFKFYYDFLYKHAIITFSLPFIIAIFIFYGWYIRKFWSIPPRLRSKRIVKAQKLFMKIIGICITFISPLIV